MNKKLNPLEVKNENITIRLKASTKDKLQLLAEANGLSQSNVIRGLIAKARATLVLKKDL